MPRATVPAILLLALPLLACRSLGPVPDDQKKMIDALGSEEWTEREEASRALVEKGAAAFDALAWAEEHDDPEVRWRAATILDAIREAEEQAERERLEAIPSRVERRKRAESGVNLGLVKTERGFYSGQTRVLPFFSHSYDRKAEESDLVLWPILSGTKKRGERRTWWSVPLLFYSQWQDEPKEIFVTSVPFFWYKYSESDEMSVFAVPLLLSGWFDNPHTRVVSIFPLFLHVANKQTQRENLLVWPLFSRFEWGPEYFYTADLTTLLWRYEQSPEGKELRLLYFLRFEWDRPARAAAP